MSTNEVKKEDSSEKLDKFVDSYATETTDHEAVPQNPKELQKNEETSQNTATDFLKNVPPEQIEEMYKILQKQKADKKAQAENQSATPNEKTQQNLQPPPLPKPQETLQSNGKGTPNDPPQNLQLVPKTFVNPEPQPEPQSKNGNGNKLPTPEELRQNKKAAGQNEDLEQEVRLGVIRKMLKTKKQKRIAAAWLAENYHINCIEQTGFWQSLINIKRNEGYKNNYVNPKEGRYPLNDVANKISEDKVRYQAWIDHSQNIRLESLESDRGIRPRLWKLMKNLFWMSLVVIFWLWFYHTFILVQSPNSGDKSTPQNKPVVVSNIIQVKKGDRLSKLHRDVEVAMFTATENEKLKYETPAEDKGRVDFQVEVKEDSRKFRVNLQNVEEKDGIVVVPNGCVVPTIHEQVKSASDTTLAKHYASFFSKVPKPKILYAYNNSSDKKETKFRILHASYISDKLLFQHVTGKVKKTKDSDDSLEAWGYTPQQLLFACFKKQ